VVWSYCRANFVFDSWTTLKLSTCAMIVIIGNSASLVMFPVFVLFLDRLQICRACRAATIAQCGGGVQSQQRLRRQKIRLRRNSFGIAQMAIDFRHRDKNGEISRKHGNTLVRTLRMTYGSGFAPGCAGDAKLRDVLANLDETSLRDLILDHDAGYLDQVCRAA